ncbi:MAG: hypothetical protein JWM41_3078 [Gemmatimonadetes bacterium]|nr:hypothetical protein [Gemmatimonadota bacterium]
MSSADPRRDEALAHVLRESRLSAPVTPARVRALSERIAAAAAPLLAERAGAGEVRQRTVWDYAASWSGVLLPAGVLTALAAGLCLFVLSAQREPSAPKLSRSRIALMGAATNRVSSQNLIDFLVASDPVAARGSVR